MDKEQQEELALLSKALAHPHRLEIIRLLNSLPGQERCMVGNLVEQLPISQATVSQHLKVLKEAGWIKGIIEGPRVCYCLKKGVFARYKRLLRDLQE
ncbi:MAG: metalloregulator ArsR/SmtB family transcription factor [Halanaerobium sp.]|nr:metalloregulator ArsR/SmtB family transcription factor [Halanaerobium sp.]